MPNRKHLTVALDQVCAAIVSRRQDLVAGARYTENGQRLPVGDGLWATADRIGPYRHSICDPESGQAALFTTLTEGASRSIMALRIRISGDAISEIEVVVARPPLFGGTSAFGDGPSALDASGSPDSRWSELAPEGEQAGRDELERIANLYFAGLEGNDGKGHYPFADGCMRIENGFRTTQVSPSSDGGKTPYLEAFRALSAKEQFETGFFRFVTRVRGRRFPVIDQARGLVFSFAFFDHAGTLREYPLADGTLRKGIDRPFTWMIAEAFRIEHGLITRIEALMTEVPYGMKSGWPEDVRV
jgi:hypothetical protein